jgi:phosphoribosyl 1,2-cyclic phosphate phosphodiesterase
MLLVDSTPDLRTQALRENIKKIDAVLFTHSHADHILGFDDLRRFCDVLGGELPIYASPETMRRLEHVFDYAFASWNTVRGYMHPKPHEVTRAFNLADFEVTPLEVPHGKTHTLGYLFSEKGEKKIAYICDCSSVPNHAIDTIKNVPVVILNALRNDPHPTHMTFSQSIQTAHQIQAGTTYFTHMTHEMSHAQRQAQLPVGMFLAYDGLVIDV